MDRVLKRGTRCIFCVVDDIGFYAEALRLFEAPSGGVVGDDDCDLCGK